MPLSSSIIACGGIATISVRPVAGLAARSTPYTATLHITGDNGFVLEIPLTFAVKASGSDEGGNGDGGGAEEGDGGNGNNGGNGSGGNGDTKGGTGGGNGGSSDSGSSDSGGSGAGALPKSGDTSSHILTVTALALAAFGTTILVARRLRKA
jgi:LPXTG-motif cell wall-anchored protein